jgi:hypothetical protein
MTSAITNPVETGGGDYVSERDAILPAWDAATLVRKALGESGG